jgi:hypothetical protein
MDLAELRDRQTIDRVAVEATALRRMELEVEVLGTGTTSEKGPLVESAAYETPQDWFFRG